MVLKKGVTYRKAQKSDYSIIKEFIRQRDQSGWECENESTAKRLSRMFFYQYMIIRDVFLVAVYRDQVVGVIITGNEKNKKFAPLYRLKKWFTLLLLRMTKEGMANLKILSQIRDMRNELHENVGGEKDFILFFYVNKNYSRNGIGTGLLTHLQETEKNPFWVYADQRDNIAFMKSMGSLKWQILYK